MDFSGNFSVLCGPLYRHLVLHELTVFRSNSYECEDVFMSTVVTKKCADYFPHPADF